MTAMKITPDAMGKYMADETSNLALMFGEWVNSEGACIFYAYKPKNEKIKIFEKWLDEEYLPMRFPEIEKEIKNQTALDNTEIK